MSYTGSDSGLLTIKDGKVPETRMADAAQCQDFVRQLINSDTDRGRNRAKVSGLTAGNPPYNRRKLRDAGQSQRFNLNFGTARSYLESGSGAFYDLSSQAPGFVSITTSYGNPEQQVEYSRTMSEQADILFSEDEEFDEDMQLSQWSMTLYGTGPLLFENEHAMFPIAVNAGDLKVPERTRSKLKRWDACAIIYDYYPPELYDFIRNEEAASAVGWDVEFTKKVIQEAMDVRQPDSATANDWEYCQQQLKASSLNYYDDSKICRVAHVFWKEFDSRISHAIVEREDTTSKGVKYLYFKRGRYENFKQAIHPQYFDRGQDGFHHGVTGLGVKQFGPMEAENRLLCNLYDKTFAPKIFFKPGTAEAKEKFQIATFSDWGLLPVGTDAVQSPIQGFLTDGLAMYKTSSELMRSTLSQYRQPVAPEKSGNPETAFKEKLDASQQSALSTTTFNRYYRQLDQLYAEIIRRGSNLNTTDERAIKWQNCCQDKGVPRECFGRIESVKAVRVVGGGNPFMRAQTTAEMTPVIGRCSEDGQNNWLNDYIASRAGQSAVNRYNPHPTSKQMASDQQFQATEGVAMAKIGIAPPVTANQNAVVFCSTYLKAGVDALQSVQQGADPNEVLHFLQTIGPAIGAHLKRIEADPMRKQIFDALKERFDQLAKLTDKLSAAVKATAAKAQAQKQKQQGVMTDAQIKAMKVQGDLRLKAQKQQATLQMQAQKHRQQLSISDATTASNIALQHARTVSDIHNSKMKAFKE